MRLVNLTPHEVVVERRDGTRETFPPSGQIARVELEDEYMFDIEGIPLHKGVVKEVTGIPSKQEGVMYIVSLFVLQCVKRPDLIAPDTHDAIRDGQGRIIAVRGWRK